MHRILPTGGEVTHDAFISYSHRGERELARALESDLRSFGRKWYQLRGLRCYRDETNLSAEPRLWPAIEQAVRSSRFLVLLASPESARSSWVPREVRAALDENPGGENIIVAQTAGTLPWTDNLPAEEVLGRDDAAIKADLLGELEERNFAPFVIDLRTFRTHEQRRERRPEYLSCVASIAARILGKKKDEIWGDYYRAQRLRSVFLGTVACVLLGLIVALGFALDSARTQLRLARSQATAGDARLQASAGELNAALRQSVAAYRHSPSVEARAALLDALGRSSHLRFFRPCGAGRKAAGLDVAPDGAPAVAFACVRTGAGSRPATSTVTAIDAEGSVDREIEAPGHVSTLAFIGTSQIAVNGTANLRLLGVSDGSVTELASSPGSRSISDLEYVPRHDALFAVEDGSRIRLWSRRAGRWESDDQSIYPAASRIAEIAYHDSLDALVVRLEDGVTLALPLGLATPPAANARALSLPGPLEESHCTRTHEPIQRILNNTVAQASGSGTLAYLTEDNSVVVEPRATDANVEKVCTILVGNTHNAMVDISPDGRFVGTVGAYFNSDAGHGLILWDLHQVHPLATVVPETNSRWIGRKLGAISRDGKSWAFALPDRVLWDGEQLPLAEPPLYATAIALSGKGDQLAMGLSDGQVEVRTRGGAPIRSRVSRSLVRSLWFDGSTLLVRDGDDDVWSAPTTVNGAPELQWKADPMTLSCSQTTLIGAALVSEKRISPDLTTLVTGTTDSSRQEKFEVPRDAGSCSALVYSSHAHRGVRLPSEYIDMVLFEPDRQPAFRTLPNPLHDKSGLRQRLMDPALSDEGHIMAVIAAGNGIALFDTDEARLIGTLRAPETSALAMSGDGKTLMTYLDGVGIVTWTLDFDRWATLAEKISGK